MRTVCDFQWTEDSIVKIMFKIADAIVKDWIPNFLNDVHLVPSVVLRDNKLLTKVPMNIDTWKMQEENILTAWQTLVSVRALIGWLQVQVMDFFFHLLFKHALCSSVKGFRPAFHQIPQSYLIWITLFTVYESTWSDYLWSFVDNEVFKIQ